MARAYRYTIDGRRLRELVGAAVAEKVDQLGDQIGSLLVTQARRAFDNGGPPNSPWEDLWVNNPAAVGRFTDTEGAEAKRLNVLAGSVRSLERVERDLLAGKISPSTARKRRASARRKHDRAAAIARAGTTDLFRGGGQPLRDTGALRESITYTKERTRDGGVLIRVGSPLEYAAYHQTGFGPTNGPNFIPLTAKAHRGWSEDLVRGYDYIVLGSVTVPARPFLVYTETENLEVERLLARAQ